MHAFEPIVCRESERATEHCDRGAGDIIQVFTPLPAPRHLDRISSRGLRRRASTFKAPSSSSARHAMGIPEDAFFLDLDDEASVGAAAFGRGLLAEDNVNACVRWEHEQRLHREDRRKGERSLRMESE